MCLSVEVPAGWLPAERELPGFNAVPGGTTLSCAYNWTASAREAMYNWAPVALNADRR